MKKVVISLALVFTSYTVLAADYTVGQKNKEFSEDELNIKVGDTVHFRNDDPFFHNIFSLSEPKSFDLGSFPQGESRSIAFDKPGTVYIECAIHPAMSLKVTVEK